MSKGRWTEADLRKLQARGAKVQGLEKKEPAVKIPAPVPEGLSHITGILTVLKIPFVTEHRFDEKRKFRFDVALLEHKIAIEYEGIFSDKSGHTTAGGYIKDCIKYNLATVKGWRILRYTSSNYSEFIRDLRQMIEI